MANKHTANRPKRKTKTRLRTSYGRFKRKQLGPKLKRMLLFIVGWIAVILLAIVIVRTFEMKIVQNGDAMLPTYEDTQVLKIDHADYLIHSVKRFDTVAVQSSESQSSNVYYVLRVVGLPGEKVQIKNGRIYIEGKKTAYPTNDASIKDAGIASEEILLGEDEYFMMCDNYNSSRNDSRSSSIGIIKKSQIEGSIR